MNLYSFVLASLFCLSYAGANLQNVEIIKTTIGSILSPSSLLEARQTSALNNVCGVKCETECIFSPGGGDIPILNDCHVIADTIRFLSENNAKTNILGTSSAGTPPDNVTMIYLTCKSIFLNQGTIPLEYCRTDWANTLDFLVPFCQGMRRAQASKCVAEDQSWSIQVQHS